MSHPYESLPSAAFWRSAVGQKEPRQIDGLWAPKFALSQQDRVVTAGSCFAQHIGRALARAGYSWYDAEPAPRYLAEEQAREFNYGIFSFRTGNIYTVALLNQWMSWVFGRTAQPDEVWLDDGRYYDPFRPDIEPHGFASREELFAARKWTMQAIYNAVTTASLFVFTLGLTEGWRNKRKGYVYPMCPGTIAGDFDASEHEFHNYQYAEIRRDLEATLDLIRSANPSIRFLLTVSPVPLTATASSQHVLVATTQSKSTLRAVAGDVAAAAVDTDYFPSYEIISSFPFKGMFYEPNMRTVAREGVEFVMRSFLDALHSETSTNRTIAAVDATGTRTAGSPAITAPPAEDPDDDIVCEDILLEAFDRSR